MPIIKSAKKAARQTIKRTKQNQQIKKSIKLATKSFKANPSQDSLSKAQSELDKAVKKGLLKKNTASRRKSSLAQTAKAAGVKLTKTSSTTPTTKPAAKKTVAKTTTTKSPAKKPTTKPATKNKA